MSSRQSKPNRDESENHSPSEETEHYTYLEEDAISGFVNQHGPSAEKKTEITLPPTLSPSKGKYQHILGQKDNASRSSLSVSKSEGYETCRPKISPSNRRETCIKQTVDTYTYDELQALSRGIEVVTSTTKGDILTGRVLYNNKDISKEGREVVTTTTKGDILTGIVLYNNKDINKEALVDMCTKYGRTSPEVMNACQHIRMQILACSLSFNDVWPTYRLTDPNNIVFVVFCEPGLDIHSMPPTSVRGFDIWYCTIGEYSNEDKEIPTEKQLFYKTEQTDQNKLTDILRKTSNHLMKKHSNLNIMTASPVNNQKHHFKREPCIVFYVRVKGYIPIQEEELPRHLGYYTTDVREGAFTLYNDPDKYTQQLKIGCSIGEDISNSHFGGSWGTLGAFVDFGRGGVGCITSAHALLDETQLFECKDKTKKDNANAASTIYQPAPTLVPIDDKQPFGRVTTVVYKTGGPHETGVEAGLITITDPIRYPDDGRFPKVAKGFTEDNQLNFMSGSVLQALPEDIGQYTFYKYGAKTGLTRGAFKLNASAIRTNGKLDVRDKCELHNQIEVISLGDQQFAEPGDSGSLVLLAPNNDLTNLHAIGILTGGNDTMFYVTPIWEVLKALELPLQLKNFSQQTLMETADGNANGVLPPEIEAIKANIKEIKTNFEKEIKLVGHKIGNVETKVDKINSELSANMEKLGSDMNASADRLGSDMTTKVDKLGSDMNKKVDRLDLGINEILTALRNK